jgi:hypothetical protein
VYLSAIFALLLLKYLHLKRELLHITILEQNLRLKIAEVPILNGLQIFLEGAFSDLHSAAYLPTRLQSDNLMELFERLLSNFVLNYLE